MTNTLSISAEQETVTGTVFNIMRYCLHDGPGIRTTVFLKGCPLHCRWCHNPEGIKRHAEIVLIESRCIRCGECFAACPEDAVSKEGDRYVMHDTRCIQCGTCIETCVTDARQLVGKEMSVREVLEETNKDKVFYDESGGGVTFSGGEPLLQHKFLLALLQGARNFGLRTAVETSGFTSPEILERVARLTDLFLYDIKHMDDERHQFLTGVSNVRILENLKQLSSWGAKVIVRIPVIPGINDDEKNFKALGEFLMHRTTVRIVQLLPFHRIGADKYRRLRKEPMPDFGDVQREKLEDVSEILCWHGLNVAGGVR